MTDDIYAILRGVPDDIDNNRIAQENFIQSIQNVRSKINSIDDARGTPITYYCHYHTQNTNSFVSYFVLNVLIKRFTANVNINSNGNIPLSIFLNSKASPSFINENIDNILLLLQFTSVKALLYERHPSLLAYIMNNPVLVHSRAIIPGTLHRFQRAVAKGKGDALISPADITTFYRQLLNDIMFLETPSHMRIVMDTLSVLNRIIRSKGIEGVHLVSLRELFIRAIEHDNSMLAKVTFKYAPYSRDLFFSKVLNQIHKKYPNDATIITKKSLNVLAKSVPLEDLKNKILIFNQILYIPDRQFLNTNLNREKHDELLSIARSILDAYNHSQDGEDVGKRDKDAARSLGFGNNILHFVALFPEFTTEEIASVYYNYQINNQDIHGLTIENRFFQTPLKVALLCANKNFLLFFAVRYPHYKFEVMDKYGNTVGHFLARVRLSESDLQFILQKLSIDVPFIRDKANDLQQTPIFDAVSVHNELFINFWHKFDGSFNTVDNKGNTLLHHLVEHENLQHDPDQLSKAFNALKNSIDQNQINIENNAGMTPVELAIMRHNPKVLALLLDAYNPIINWNHSNSKSGETIAHVMARTFVIDKYSTPHLAEEVEMVQVLSKYADSIKETFNTRTKGSVELLPIDIIESGTNTPFQHWIHHLVSRAMLSVVKASKDKKSDVSVLHRPRNDDTSDSDLNTHDYMSTGTLLSSDKDSKHYYDNYVWNFKPDVIQQANKVFTTDLPQQIQDRIHSLSFFIAYSNLNNYGDKLGHILLGQNQMELNSDKTLIHILNILSPQFINTIYTTPNKLGQYVLHIAVQTDHSNVIEHALSINFDLINQSTSHFIDISAEELFSKTLIKKWDKNNIQLIFQNLYPGFFIADYAIILGRDNIMDKLFDALRKKRAMHGQKLFITCNMLYEGATTDAKDLIKYTDKSAAYNALEAPLASYRDMIAGRLVFVNKQNQYQPLFPMNMMEVIHENIRSPYVDNIAIVDFVKLESLLLEDWHVFRDQERLKGLILADFRHASVILLFKDKFGVCHAFIQDSGYDRNNKAYTARVNKIKRILLASQYIENVNIHELNIHQQASFERNCALWSIANIKVMMSQLLRHKWWSCVTCATNQFIVKSVICSDTVDHMRAEIRQQVPALQSKLQYFVLDYNQKQYLILPEITFDISINDDGATQYVDTIDVPQMQDRDLMLNHKHIPLSDENIRNIINSEYAISGFTVYPDDNYIHATRRLIILPDLIEGKNALSHHINNFVLFTRERFAQHGDVSLSTITFIINQDSNHWVTLVISAHHDKYTAYFSDSYGVKLVPATILEVLKTFKIVGNKVYNLSVEQQFDEYNCGLWAIENAVNINDILFAHMEQPLSIIDIRIQLLELCEDSIQNFDAIRDRFKSELINDYLQERQTQAIKKIDNLQAVEKNLKLMYENFDCIPSSSTARTKRSICDDDKIIDQVPKKIQYYPLEEHLPPAIKIQVQLCRNIALLLSLKNFTPDDNSIKLGDFINHIRNIGDIIHEGIENQSAREKQILEEYYNTAQSFLSVFSKKRLLTLIQAPTQDLPLLFDNGQHSLIVYHQHGRYKFYSQNYHYQHIFEVTKENATFDEIKNFASIFFTWCHGDSAEYNIYILSNEALAPDVVIQLKKMNIWNPQAVEPDAVQLYAKSIQGVSSTTIRKLFFVNGRIPELSELKDGVFFLNPIIRKSLSVRIEKLHEALLSNPDQAPKVISLIKRYDIKIDNTYITKVRYDYQEVYTHYYSNVKNVLASSSLITINSLSKLSWQALNNNIATYSQDIEVDLRNKIIEMSKVLHTKVVEHMHNMNINCPSLLFIPDTIRVDNFNNYAPLVTMGGIMDMESIVGKVNNLLLMKLSSIIPNERIELIKKYIPINAPVMQGLMLYSTYELSQRLKILSPESEEYKIVKHHLMKTKAVFVISTLDAFVPFARNGVYNILILSDNLPEDFAQYFSIDQLVDSTQWLPDNLLSDNSEFDTIEGLTKETILKIFKINGNNIQEDSLDKEYFSINHKALELQIQNLHKLDDSALTTLVSVISKYDIAVDQTYIYTLRHEERDLMLRYYNYVRPYLKQKISKQILSELTWKALQDELSTHPGISEGDARNIIMNVQKVFLAIAKASLKYTLDTQFLLFLPDLIRSFNTGDWHNLKTTVEIMSGDMLMNTVFEALVTKLDNKVISESNMKILRAVPANGIIFQILTIHTIYDLHEQLNTLDPSTLEYTLIQESLIDQYYVLSTICLSIMGIETSVFWISGVAANLFSTAALLNRKFNLNISSWEGVLIALGFEKDELSKLIVESMLVHINLQLANAANQDVIIIKIPDVSNDMHEYRNVSKAQIPDIVLNGLLEKKDRVAMKDYDNSILQVDYMGYRVISHYTYSILNGNIKNKIINSTYYQRDYKYAFPSDSILSFDSYHGYKAIYNDHDKKHKVFADSIIDNNNYTWLRNPSLQFPHVGTHRILVSDAAKEGYPVERDTGNLAFYWQRNYKARKKHLNNKDIGIFFDPREGSTNITLTTKGIRELDRFFAKNFDIAQNASNLFKIVVRHKPYDGIILANKYSNMTLIDLSGQVTSEYILYDARDLTYNIYDTTCHTKMEFLDPVQSDLAYSNLIEGMHGNIIIRAQLKNNTEISKNNIYIGTKKSFYLSLTPRYFIGQNLTLQADELTIVGLQGISNSSKIIINNSKFQFFVDGKIIIDDSSTQLHITGAEYGVFVNHNETSQYNVEFANIQPDFKTIAYHIDQYGCSIELISTNALYRWQDTACNNTLSISVRMIFTKALSHIKYMTISNKIGSMEIWFHKPLFHHNINQENEGMVIVDGLKIQNPPQQTYMHFTDKTVPITNLTNAYVSTIVDYIMDGQNVPVLREALIKTHTMHGVIVTSNGEVSQNSFEAFIEGLSQMHTGIHTLNLSGNNLSRRITKLTTVLPRITDLKVLTLRNSSLDDHDLTLLFKELLPKMTQLDVIDVSYNDFNNHDDLVPLIDYACPNVPNMQKIYMSFSQFDPSALELLQSQHECNKYLQILDVEAYPPQELNSPPPMINVHLQETQNAGSVLNVLNQCQDTPYEIIFADHALTRERFIAFIKLLGTRQFCNIRVLDLSNNADLIHNVHDWIKFLPTVYGLEVLKLRSCKIDNSIFRELLNMLEQTNITELDVSDNDIGNQGIDNISRHKCSNITSRPKPITINISGSKASALNLKLLHADMAKDCDHIKIITTNESVVRTIRDISYYSNTEEPSYLSSTLDTSINELDMRDTNDYMLHTTSGTGSSIPIGYAWIKCLYKTLYNAVTIWQNKHLSNTENTPHSSADIILPTIEHNVIDNISLVPVGSVQQISDHDKTNTNTNTNISPVVNFSDLLVLTNYFTRMLTGEKYNNDIILHRNVIIPEHADLGYGRRLAYSHYVPAIEQNEEDLQLAGVA